MIDKTKKFWTGDQPDDIREYLTAFSRIPTLETKPVICRKCGGDTVTIRADLDESGLQVICTNCKTKKLLLDSDEIWEDCSPRPVRCPVCKERNYNTRVGFLRRENGDVKHVFIGVRCTGCGTLGCLTDWRIDYSPTDEMEQNI